MEVSGGSPAWQFIACMDISEEGPETLVEINASWRAKQWLEVAAEGIRDEEVPWHNLLAPLTSGAEGTTKALAKCLVAVWRWNIKVQGEQVYLPTPTVLNIGQFLTDQETGRLGRATLVCGLLPHATKSGRGSLQKEVGHTVRGPGDQSLPIGACLLARD